MAADQAKTILQQYIQFEPRDGQIVALLELYSGRDCILIAPYRWGKTITITSLPCLLQQPY